MPLNYAERLAVALFHFHASLCILVRIIHLTTCEIGLTAVHRQPVNPSLVTQFEMLVQTLEMSQGIQVYWPQFRNHFQVAFLKEYSMSSAGEFSIYLIKVRKTFWFYDWHLESRSLQSIYTFI